MAQRNYDLPNCSRSVRLEMLKEALVRYAETAQGEWVAGIGLIYGVLPDGSSITRHHLDEIFPDRPVYLVAYDGHTAWANTEALQRADLYERETSWVHFSEDRHGRRRFATGELREPPAMNARSRN
jgi:predicted amidohydrolase YtcJ